MSAKKELRRLSKNELIEIILELRDKLEKIEATLHQYDNPNTPSSQERFKENTRSKEEKLKE